jgi:NitT/TauT family transport system substrate-binding protein
LEGYLPAEKINLVHYGSPNHRFDALMRGEVAAALVMEPWIALAEKNGCKVLCEGHYLGAENANDDMDEETFEAVNRAVRRAVQLINSDKKKYLHYLIDDMKDLPPKYGHLTPDDFHLPRLRYVEPQPYPEEVMLDTYQWMVRWGLISPSAEVHELVDNRSQTPVHTR